MASDKNIQELNIRATADVGNATKGLSDLSATVKSLETEMKGLKFPKVDTSFMSTSQLKRGLSDAQSTVRSAFTQMQKYADNPKSQMFRNAFVDMKEAENRLDTFKSALQNARGEFGEKADFPISISKPADMSKVEDYPYGKTIQIPADIQMGSSEEAIASINNTNVATEESISKFAILREKIASAFSSESLKAFSEKMSGISEKANELAGKMKEVASKVGSVGKKFLSAINPMKMFGNEQKRTANSSSLLGKAFSRVARMFRIMVTRMLIRGFISNIREGFKNIAQYSDEVNQKFSAIMNSAKALYNSFAGAFTPIIEAISPAITWLLDMFTSVMNKIAEFMSALTGKSYFIKAIKNNNSYAGSLDNTGKSAGKTAKKLKELKSATIGIDKLNVIEPNQPTDSGAGGGGGAGGAGGAGSMFDTKPVSKKMQNLAKEVRKIAGKLFDPIQKAWNSKGKFVIDSWKRALSSIWQTIKAIGRDFLTVWQQPQTVKIFEDILSIVGEIGLIVSAISDNFRSAWTKDNIGLKIFENLRDVIGIVVERFKRCAEYTREWAKNLNFTPLLQSIERYTKSLKKLMQGLSDIAGDFYETVVLGISKWVVEKGLPNLVQVFTDFNNKVNWSELQKHLHNVWVGVEKFGETLGQGLINFIHDVADGIANLLNSKWFTDFLDGVGKALKSIKPEQVTSAIKLFIKAWLGLKAISFVTGTLSKLATGIIKLRIAMDSLAKVKTSSIFTKLFGGTGGLLKAAGGLAGITAGAVAVAEIMYMPLKLAEKENEKTLEKIKSDYEKFKLSDSFKGYLNELDTANQKIIEHGQEVDNINTDIINATNKVTFYKSELDKIVSANGTIKDGYKTQAEYLVGEINNALGTNYEIIGNQVQGYKEMNKSLKKQISLVETKKLLEANAGEYYNAKANIGKKGKDVKSAEERFNTSKAKEEYDKYTKAIEADEAKIRQARARSDKQAEEQAEASKTNNENLRKVYEDDYFALKNNLDKNKQSYSEYYKTILRNEELYQAKTQGQREKAMQKFGTDLTSYEKAILPTLETIADSTGISMEEAISKFVKNGKLKFDTLPQIAKEKIAEIEQQKLQAPEFNQQSVAEFETSLNNLGKKYGKDIKNGIYFAMSTGKIDFSDAFDFVSSLENARQQGIDINQNLIDGVTSGKIDPDTAIDYTNALTNASKNGVNVSKYVGNGIFKNKKSVKTAIDGLNTEVDKLPKKKDTKVNVTNKKDYVKDTEETISAAKNIPSKKSTLIDIILNFTGQISKTLWNVLSNIKKQISDFFNIGKNDNKKKKKKTSVTKHANGGFPKLGSAFIAGEAGAEFVGNINGKTGVASNQEITGIREAIIDSTNVQNQILIEQNGLLRGILAKETNVVLDGVKLTKKINKINSRSGYNLATT